MRWCLAMYSDLRDGSEVARGSTIPLDGESDNRLGVTVTIPAKTGYLRLRNRVISGYLSYTATYCIIALYGCISTERLHRCNHLGSLSIL
jgi:hypothetical protein